MTPRFVYTAIITIILLSGCKEAEITSPPPPDFNDFSLPGSAISYKTPKVILTMNMENNVAYLGEKFEIKVSLLNMPDNFYGTSLVIPIPKEIEIDTILMNKNNTPNLFKPVAATVMGPIYDALRNLSLFAYYRGDFFRQDSTNKGGSGVVCKLICHAITVSDNLKIDFLKDSMNSYDNQNGVFTYRAPVAINLYDLLVPLSLSIQEL